MTFSKLTWIKAITVAEGLSVTAKLVGVALGNYTNSLGENAHPGTRRLADDLDVTRKTIERQLVTLRDTGWVVLIRRSNDAGRRNYADVYRIQIPADRQTPMSPDQETDRGTFEDDRGTFETDRQTPMSHQQIFTNRSFNHQIVGKQTLRNAHGEKLLAPDSSKEFETEKLRQTQALQARIDDERDAS